MPTPPRPSSTRCSPRGPRSRSTCSTEVRTSASLTNGANHKGIYKSHVTSYDYDAPLDEAGHPTAKFHAFKAVLARHGGVPAQDPPARPVAPAFVEPMTRRVSLAAVRDQLGSWRPSETPPTMDELEHYRGFCVYRTALPGAGGVLAVDSVRDRAIVSVDGSPVGVLERDRHDHALVVSAGRVLELLVEDRGRVNYGSRLGEPKGIVGDVRLNGDRLRGWEVLPLALDQLPDGLLANASPVDGPLAGPAFLSTEVPLDRPTDLFLDTAGWGKGVVWVNGFNLGRYWSRGPQRTLYVPTGTLRAGPNQLVVLELQAIVEPSARFLPEPALGHVEE